MKKLFLLLTVTCFMQHMIAQTIQFDSIGYINLQIGKVIQKGETWIIRAGEGNNIKDYIPVIMPEKYKIQNQDVVFEAALGAVPVGPRMAGIPVKIISIRKLYKTKPKDATEEMTKNTVKKKVNAFDSIGYVKNAKGKIIKIADTWLIEQSELNNSTRYVPDFIPVDFQVENLPVQFSGVVGKSDPNVRMMGKPFQIKELMAEEENTFDPSEIQPALKDIYPIDSADKLDKTEGVIKKMNDTFIIEIGDSKRYIPLVLPKAFQQENMIVIVSGIIGQIPSNVRLIGTPLEVQTIEKK